MVVTESGIRCSEILTDEHLPATRNKTSNKTVTSCGREAGVWESTL